MWQCRITSLHGLAGAGASQLENLTLYNCGALTSLEPMRACTLSRLTHLNLHWCVALQSLDSLGRLPALVSLNLRACEELTSLCWLWVRSACG